MRAVLCLKRHSTIQRTVVLAPPEEIRKVTNQCAYDTFEWALSQGHDKVAISLVERDPAFVHGRYTRGITPLMKAVPTGRIPVIAALIQHGASVNAADSGGSTPLMAAACMALFDVVRFLLEQPGLNIDAVDLDGMSALHWAVWAVQPDIVQLLLDKGANPLLLVQALLQRLGTSQDQSPP
ncbi:Ankyrin repeat containing protein [Acanthamoeba castellanii str. Neff]|uniref:Ankyrin repeat containing protein n=1 Tax=Acanthamoeba castellanii (strain ATCC 30010 / Neff) TaxID=1257118 RepID=L8GM05_ACACF|nr:Ankyrin repeat containing protein [Acanthamoeba castellanii str. Neff]ELR13768.1 Ankyrin repeat containing protein [Acanthamoeba castellanii str. Neff]